MSTSEVTEDQNSEVGNRELCYGEVIRTINQPISESNGLIETWIKRVGERVESVCEYKITKKSDFFHVPRFYCPPDFLPVIGEFDSVEDLKSLKQRVEKTQFDNLEAKDFFSSMIDKRIEQLSLPPEVKWSVSENKIEKIESIPIGARLDRFEQDEDNISNINEIQEILSDIDSNELGFLSTVLKIRNYGFPSPHATLVDTIRKARGEDIDLENLINIYGEAGERERIFTRLENMIDTINEYVLGVALGSLSFVSVGDLYEDTMTEIGASMGGMLAEKQIMGSGENYMIMRSEDMTFDGIQREVPEEVLGKRDFDSHKEMYEKVHKPASSVFSHEFAHLIDSIWGIRNSEPVGFYLGISEEIKEVYEKNFEYDKYLLSDKGEFIALIIDLWVNEPERLKSEYPEAHSLLKESISSELSVSELPINDSTL